MCPEHAPTDVPSNIYPKERSKRTTGGRKEQGQLTKSTSPGQCRCLCAVHGSCEGDLFHCRRVSRHVVRPSHSHAAHMNIPPACAQQSSHPHIQHTRSITSRSQPSAGGTGRNSATAHPQHTRLPNHRHRATPRQPRRLLHGVRRRHRRTVGRPRGGERQLRRARVSGRRRGGRRPPAHAPSAHRRRIPRAAQGHPQQQAGRGAVLRV